MDSFQLIEALLKPEGRLLGQPGSSRRIRILPGGIEAATELYEKLAEAGKEARAANYPGTLVEIPDVGRVGLRPVSVSGPPTIDVRVSGIGIDEIKFPQEA